jgi:hypothetical protein
MLLLRAVRGRALAAPVRVLGAAAAAPAAVRLGAAAPHHSLLLRSGGARTSARGLASATPARRARAELEPKKQSDQLVEAAKSGDAVAITELVAKGADPDSADETGQPALVMAAAYGQRAAVEALVEGGASVDKAGGAGRTALMSAAAVGIEGTSDCLPPLLVNHADVTAKVHGQTALDQAKATNNTKCVAVLEAWAAGTRDPAALEVIAKAAAEKAKVRFQPSLKQNTH